MTREERGQVARAWAMLGEYFRQPLADVVIGMYVEDVDALTLAQVLTALRALRTEPGRQRVPTPGDVLARIKALPPDPAETAARIVGGMTRYGYTQPEKARAAIGEQGWEAVEMFGGWTQLCQTTLTSEVPSLRAQLRDALRGIAARAARDIMPHRVLPAAEAAGKPGRALAAESPQPRSKPCQMPQRPNALSLARRLMEN